MLKLKKIGKYAPFLLLLSVSASAQTTDLAALAAKVDANAAQDGYIFNTLLFLIGGFLVMWMAAGFAMLEAGLVRSKNVSMQCPKKYLSLCRCRDHVLDRRI